MKEKTKDIIYILVIYTILVTIIRLTEYLFGIIDINTLLIEMLVTLSIDIIIILIAIVLDMKGIIQ